MERRVATSTMAPKDTTCTIDPAVGNHENRYKVLRHDMVSGNGRSIGSGGMSVPIAEVAGMNDSTSQLGATDSILVGTDAVTDTPLAKDLLLSAQSSDGLAPRLKANCDVALRPRFSTTSIVVVIRDSRGLFVEGAICFEKVRSVMQDEALAVRWACLMARSLNLSQVEIVGDNKTMISLCVFEVVPPWKCAPIIEDIRSLAIQCNFSFLWTPYKANSAAN
ncbi:hypothetical protein LOK49_LG14G00812 [Camellia lanceoleosa]|uniref:Uncharacterized protein n=1 Tax=Camellia lanceoleosa TaxID=1840588 RepID=A0ACC0F9S5_9ERIC|nr:hypothetical protein LOK49_LG14G00812 [Camellia lanceoleosa]